MVANCRKEVLIHDDLNPSVLCRVPACNVARSIRAAVVDDNVLPLLVRLSENALNAFSEVPLLVIDGRHHAHQRLMAVLHAEGLFPKRLSNWLSNKSRYVIDASRN